MSREEILEKLSDDLKSMLHYMDSFFDEYILTNEEKTLEVKRCYEDYTLDEISGSVEIVNPNNVEYIEELKKKYDVVVKEEKWH